MQQRGVSAEGGRRGHRKVDYLAFLEINLLHTVTKVAVNQLTCRKQDTRVLRPAYSGQIPRGAAYKPISPLGI